MVQTGSNTVQTQFKHGSDWFDRDKLIETGGGRRRIAEADVEQKLEPHTKMWGKTQCLVQGHTLRQGAALSLRCTTVAAFGPVCSQDQTFQQRTATITGQRVKREVGASASSFARSSFSCQNARMTANFSQLQSTIYIMCMYIYICVCVYTYKWK